MIAVLVIALPVFGPSKIPEIGGALGRSIREFRRTNRATTKTASLLRKAADLSAC